MSAAPSQRGVSPDAQDSPKTWPNHLPPAMVKWMNSPEYKQWAATHGNYKAYWHCWNPKTKEFYGVQTGSLQGYPPANCLPGPQAQQ